MIRLGCCHCHIHNTAEAKTETQAEKNTYLETESQPLSERPKQHATQNIYMSLVLATAQKKPQKRLGQEESSSHEKMTGHRTHRAPFCLCLVHQIQPPARIQDLVYPDVGSCVGPCGKTILRVLWPTVRLCHVCFMQASKALCRLGKRAWQRLDLSIRSGNGE